MKQLTAPAEAVSGAETSHVFHTWSARSGEASIQAGRWRRQLVLGRIWAPISRFASQPDVYILATSTALIAAIEDQADIMCTLAPDFANDRRSELAGLIAARAPGNLTTVSLTNAGTEANEHALRMARLHTGRYRCSVPTAISRSDTGVDCPHR